MKVLDPWLAEDGPGLELVGAYLADRCVVDPDRTTLRVDLYRAFSAWAVEAGGDPVNRERFEAGAVACGLQRCNGRHGGRWRGVALEVSPTDGGPVVATDPPGRPTAA